MLGGIGSCGRELCCCTFLSEFQPVSIRMAKKQDLSLNPAKISGLCGRLMCCLRFESDHYPDATKPTAAHAGQAVVGGAGEAAVVGGAGEAAVVGGAGETEDKPEELAEVTGPVPVEEDRV